MRPKWVRYMAMGIALLLAIVMTISLTRGSSSARRE